jgi:hypothetical protein
MALTHFYVDPSINANSGAGTVGDPYGDLQYGLDNATAGSGGNQWNIKAGTDEVMSAAISLATFGTPTVSNPIIFRGYTSAAGDGGIGGISGGGSVSVFASTSIDYVIFIDMHLHNTGSAIVIQVDNNCSFINCEIDNSTNHAIDGDVDCVVANCHIHNIGGNGLIGGRLSLFYNNVLENGTNDFDTAIILGAGGAGSMALNNIVSIDGASNGIEADLDSAIVMGNTVYSNGGTGSGIIFPTACQMGQCLNNYVEGFSGSGGIGFEFQSGSYVIAYQSNRFYNNATNESKSGDIIQDSDNSAVGSSALSAPGSGDFSAGTDLKAAAYPSTFKGISTDQFTDIGAAQREEPAGGGGGLLTHPAMSGGIRG